jgi:[protein-PII] uridylyltransferase
VRAPDGVGVLSRIARALTATGCDVSVVRALTLGAEVVDIFYVTKDGAKIIEPEARAEVEAAILRELRAE